MIQKLRYIVLPALLGDTADLSEAQLAAIAGGGTSSVTNTQTPTDVSGGVEVAAAGPVVPAAVCVVVAT